MKKGKSLGLALVLVFLVNFSVFADELSDNWGDFLHYIKIGRLDLAKGYGQNVIGSEPDPKVILEYFSGNPNAAVLLNKGADNKHDAEFADICSKMLALVEQGKYARRTESAIIAGEVRRLSSDTARGRLLAIKRLKDSGEYAIPFMLDAMADPARENELPFIIKALPMIGKDAIRPLAAALETKNVAVKTEIVKALGKIGYPQSLGYLKYVSENDESVQVKDAAATSIGQINKAAMNKSAAEYFYGLAEDYYYHADSLDPAEKETFGNIWFWDVENQSLIREKVDRKYFYELMSMRCCEWALRADAGYGKAIGLWIAAFLKAEETGIAMPKYFGDGHGPASVYAQTAGPEYLHQALSRAVKDKNAFIALHTIEALATNAGEQSLVYRLGTEQPLLAALEFDNKAVRYSAAIALGAAGPKQFFQQNKLAVKNLAMALRENAAEVTGSSELWSGEIAETYALRAAQVMLKLAIERNKVLDLSDAQEALVDASKDQRVPIKVNALQILSYLPSTTAQKAIATTALDQDNALDIRLAAFGSLAISAKINANQLGESQIDEIYSIVSSEEADEKLRAAASAAYGALNLPSQKVKDLILDQARK